jgi:ABC-type multidrug transport system fused ATPase/permease subunit
VEEGSREELEARLKVDVTDGGGNFSLGQRQFLCMARALIRKPKVLLMDEATASIDEMTDHLIQKMIRDEFHNTTVITIAHRLNSIIHYDRIMILEKGVVAEFDTPYNLLQNPAGYFAKLFKEQGQQFESKMKNLAAQKQREIE